MEVIMNLKQFGGKLSPELINRYASSRNWVNGRFMNLEETGMNIRIWNVPGLIYKQLTSKNRRPEQPLEVLPFDEQAFNGGDGKAKFVWYGHSAVLIKMNGKNIFIDPMMGDNASPPAPVRTRRFSEHTLSTLDDLPEIDLLLLTHDHYDHLDHASILKLMPKTKQYFVALGVKRHLTAWGIDAASITEFDWWDSKGLGDIEITFTPSRHFSGRGLRDRNRSLWGGWALKSSAGKIFFSGDGGYGGHFSEIGDRLGPFDLAFMECGQYNELWRQIHMMPEESVMAAKDVKALRAVPVHWGAFTLALHDWKEPAARFAAEALNTGMEACFPRLGAVNGPGDASGDTWWMAFGSSQQDDPEK